MPSLENIVVGVWGNDEDYLIQDSKYHKVSSALRQAMMHMEWTLVTAYN